MIQQAVIWCICENSVLGVYWEEKEKLYIKYIKMDDVLIQKKKRNFCLIFSFICLIKLKTIFTILAIYLFLNGIVNNYQSFDSDYKHCLLEKKHSTFDFIFQVKCRNKATIFNV